VLLDVESVLSMKRDAASPLFIIGGATIYEAFLPFIERWIVTAVPLEVADADTLMPAGYLDGFELYEVRQLDDELQVKFYERL